MTCRLAFLPSFGVLLFVLCAVAQEPPAPAVPSEREIAMGRAMAAELEAGAAPLNDPAAVELVEEIAQKLAEASGTQTFLKVRLLDNPEAAAHSLPGGFLFVRSGLVAGSETIAELAGVLAHEIGHIAAGHSKPKTSQPPGLGDTTSVPFVFLGGRWGTCLRNAANSAAPLNWRRNASRQEEEADSLALLYLEKAGYDPSGLVRAFDRNVVEGIAEDARMTSATRDKARAYSSSERTYLVTRADFAEIRERLARQATRAASATAPSLLRQDGR